MRVTTEIRVHDLRFPASGVFGHAEALCATSRQYLDLLAILSYARSTLR
jgi:hypothetical protein